MAYLKPQSPLQKEGDYFYPLTTVDQVIMEDGRRLNAKLDDGSILSYSTTITTEWTGDTAPYTQEIAVLGILEGDKPITDIIVSEDPDVADSQETEWGKIYKITTAENKIIVYASEKTEIALDIQMAVNRNMILNAALVDGTVLIDESVTAKKLNDDAKALSFTVTLLPSDWDNNQLTINSENFISSGFVYWVSPNSDSFEDWGAAGIKADDVTVNGIMTLYCQSVPTVEVIANITRMVSV